MQLIRDYTNANIKYTTKARAKQSKIDPQLKKNNNAHDGVDTGIGLSFKLRLPIYAKFFNFFARLFILLLVLQVSYIGER